MQGFSVLAGYMSTFRNGNLEKISLVSTFEKPYSEKMWLMSTFENENFKIIFFVSTFLDWYKALSYCSCYHLFLREFLRKVV